MRLAGRNLVVVGVGPGLGSAVVYLALREGAQVYGFARNKEFLSQLARAMSPYGRVYTGVADFSNWAEAKRAAEEAAKVFDAVHGLVVAAGGYVAGGVEELEPEQLEDMLARNLKAHLYAVKAFSKLMAEGSSVVLVSSIGGAYAAWPKHIAYVAAKAAVAKAAESLAAELIDRGIRVNVVAPGGMSKDFAPGRQYQRPRLGAPQAPPEEVAKVVIWLLTDEAGWINGAVIPVDGGRRLRG